MRAKNILDLVEDLIKQESSQVYPVGRERLLSFLTLALGNLNDQFNSQIRKLDPIALTANGVREYPLPEDFGENFIKRGSIWLCKCQDSSSEWTLEFEPAEDFYQRDLFAETSARPYAYTILTGFDGRKKLVISPPADGEYKVYGLYRPVMLQVTEETDLAFVNNPNYLVFYVASLADPTNQRFFIEAQKAERLVYMNAARDKAAFIAPREQ